MKLYLIIGLAIASTLLISCISMRRVVQPVEAVQICGKQSIKHYSALSGHVECGERD